MTNAGILYSPGCSLEPISNSRATSPACITPWPIWVRHPTMCRHWLYRKPDPSISMRSPPGASEMPTLFSVLIGLGSGSLAGILENCLKSWQPTKSAAALLEENVYLLWIQALSASSSIFPMYDRGHTLLWGFFGDYKQSVKLLADCHILSGLRGCKVLSTSLQDLSHAHPL